MTSQDLILSTALQSNKHWASYTSSTNPTFFHSLSQSQTPSILWLGCSDSRCPETTLLGLQPGDVFTHRNIANIISENDISVNAVIEYAVTHLRVKSVFVVGHSCCGGVQAVLRSSDAERNKGKDSSPLTPWLSPLRQLARENRALLKTLDPESAALKLVEINVLSGVKNVKGKRVVREAMRDRGVRVHGLIYDVGCGILREVDYGAGGRTVSSRKSAEGRNAESRSGRVGAGGRRGSLFV
ncbi:hypothetical protein BDV06DRAFT_203583 [Aspergillus oleicola]